MTSLQLSESEFHVVQVLTEKTFHNKASDVRDTDSKFLSEERNVRVVSVRADHSDAVVS